MKPILFSCKSVCIVLLLAAQIPDPVAGDVIANGPAVPATLETNQAVIGNNATSGGISGSFTNSTNEIPILLYNPCAQLFPTNYVDPGGLLAGFQTNTLRPSFDDVSSGLVLPFPIYVCGTWYSNVWVNEDGNVTLDGPFSGHIPPSYVPALALTNLNRVIFAPFWADLDTTTNGTGSIGWGINCAFATDPGQGCRAFGVTWTKVGYYKGHTDKANNFQLLFIDRSVPETPAFDLQYRYGGIQWDTSDSAAGSGGLCPVLVGNQAGYPARVGFFGGPHCAFELPGSGIAGALIEKGPNSLQAHGTSSATNGVYTWHFKDGLPTPGF